MVKKATFEAIRATQHDKSTFFTIQTLDCRWSDILLASTITREKTLLVLNMQKMCAEVDAHKKWITFIRRSRQIFNKFWRMPSKSQRTAQNSSFFCALDVRDGMCDWALRTGFKDSFWVTIQTITYDCILLLFVCPLYTTPKGNKLIIKL